MLKVPVQEIYFKISNRNVNPMLKVPVQEIYFKISNGNVKIYALKTCRRFLN
jgi:hypothetical protein